jgi:hypothetical protein
MSLPAGRHPLAELLAPGRFIDNDTTLGSLQAAGGRAPAAAAPGVGGGGGSGGGSRMLLITGPNASGKSVYMKQVGVRVLAQGHVCTQHTTMDTRLVCACVGWRPTPRSSMCMHPMLPHEPFACPENTPRWRCWCSWRTLAALCRRAQR